MLAVLLFVICIVLLPVTICFWQLSTFVAESLSVLLACTILLSMLTVLDLFAHPVSLLFPQSSSELTRFNTLIPVKGLEVQCAIAPSPSRPCSLFGEGNCSSAEPSSC